MPDERKDPRKGARTFHQALSGNWPENIRQGIAIASREIPDLGTIEPYGAPMPTSPLVERSTSIRPVWRA
jgi:hypothetical protein